MDHDNPITGTADIRAALGAENTQVLKALHTPIGIGPEPTYKTPPPCIAKEAPPRPFVEPGYERLADVLSRAFDQAARGKGKERHAQGLPFHDQPMQNLIGLYGPGFAAGQAAKKAQEAMRMSRQAKVHELLGAIVYLAGLVVYEEARHAD